MRRKTYVSSLCVLLFLIIEDANVNASSLAPCDNPLENEVCNITCTTTDHQRTVAFNKVPDITIIAQCVPVVGCFESGKYSISQPNSMSTVLSFMHSRNDAGNWTCSYGAEPTSVSVPWATYPQTVSTTLTSNTTVDTNIDGNVTLGCLYSEEAPTVTLQYEDANGNNDAISAETFQCDATDIPCTDVNFTTYGCPVVVKEETGIDHSDTYSIKLKIKVTHVQREDVHTIVTDITFKRSGGTSTSTDNNGKALVILCSCLFVAYLIVVAIRCCAESTKNAFWNCCLTLWESSVEIFVGCCLIICVSIVKRCFDRCGCQSSQESEDDPGFFKDKVCTLNSLLGFTYLVLYGFIVGVIVLLAVYYGSDKFQEGPVIGVGFGMLLVLSFLFLLVVLWMLMKFFNNGASVTPQNRPQPDGDEGPQSTSNDPDTRHLITGRPLPRRPDIASPKTGSFDSVNSPRPNVLVPIENPNILPSIDTLDEQKTDKKPKDKKKKRKKKKDEEQDNPADVQDNNVLT